MVNLIVTFTIRQKSGSGRRFTSGRRNPMAEKPIIFSGEMVRAILDGRKTQTRRVMKVQPPSKEYRICTVIGEQRKAGRYFWAIVKNNNEIVKDQGVYFKNPYAVGDVLWVKENWRKRPSIHMPRRAARIFLEVKSIRVERVQDISKEDCLAEGIKAENPWVWVWVYEFERINLGRKKIKSF